MSGTKILLGGFNESVGENQRTPTTLYKHGKRKETIVDKTSLPLWHTYTYIL